jgi:hypothetical protein
MRVCISGSETEFDKRMLEMMLTYLVVFAAGNLHESFVVSNSMPSTLLPRVDFEKAFSLFGQSGANLKLHSEQSFFVFFSKLSSPWFVGGANERGVI